uniref:Uncharacterized protein n=1 Tax=Lactuca sativa TaxID=4236 RepID=A0A9R1V200_LACSA|nr:hypothetical protein LSAT_V11C700362820 [Lactuca sativa]
MSLSSVPPTPPPPAPPSSIISLPFSTRVFLPALKLMFRDMVLIDSESAPSPPTSSASPEYLRHSSSFAKCNKLFISCCRIQKIKFIKNNLKCLQSTQFDLQLHERQSEMDVRQTQLQENGGHFETFEQTTL